MTPYVQGQTLALTALGMEKLSWAWVPAVMRGGGAWAGRAMPNAVNAFRAGGVMNVAKAAVPNTVNHVVNTVKAAPVSSAIIGGSAAASPNHATNSQGQQRGFLSQAARRAGSAGAAVATGGLSTMFGV